MKFAANALHRIHEIDRAIESGVHTPAAIEDAPEPEAEPEPEPAQSEEEPHQEGEL